MRRQRPRYLIAVTKFLTKIKSLIFKIQKCHRKTNLEYLFHFEEGKTQGFVETIANCENSFPDASNSLFFKQMFKEEMFINWIRL